MQIIPSMHQLFWSKMLCWDIQTDAYANTLTVKLLLQLWVRHPLSDDQSVPGLYSLPSRTQATCSHCPQQSPEPESGGMYCQPCKQQLLYPCPLKSLNCETYRHLPSFPASRMYTSVLIYLLSCALIFTWTHAHVKQVSSEQWFLKCIFVYTGSLSHFTTCTLTLFSLLYIITALSPKMFLVITLFFLTSKKV